MKEQKQSPKAQHFPAHVYRKTKYRAEQHSIEAQFSMPKVVIVKTIIRSEQLVSDGHRGCAMKVKGS